MLRALFTLLIVGVAGVAAMGMVFAFVVPLAVLAVKVLLVLLLGYVILRLVRPDVADDLRGRMRGERS